MFDAAGDVLGGLFDGGFFGDAASGLGDWASSGGWTGEADGLLARIFSGEGLFTDGVEAILSRFGGSAGTLFEDYLQFRMWQGISGDSAKGFGAWKVGGGSGHDALIAEAGDALKSHMLLLEQLEKHAPNSEALARYRELGIKLPDEELLRQVKKALSGKLHPDRHMGDNDLMSKVNQALDIIGNEEKTAPYRDILQKAESDAELRGRIEGFLKDFAGKQSEFYEKAAQNAKLLLPFGGKNTEDMGTAERVSNSIYEGMKNAGPVKQGVIAFGLVASTSLLAYGFAKWQENKRKATSHVDSLDKKQAQASIAL